MQLITPRLTLRSFAAEDAPALTRALSDPRIFTYLPEAVPELADCERLIARFIERDAHNRRNRFIGTNFALTLRRNRCIIGWCGLQPFDAYPDQMEIFYGVSPAYWEQGYASEAAGAVLTYGFEALALDQIVAGVKPGNRASIRVLEKIGLSYRGIIDRVPAGAEWYLGERYYTIDREGYLARSPG
ncbi:MAG: GNAT family N-acetyltransferase [Desulfosarcinaceae bacterium]|nr:GNAT family N-acetyltransferase [Desulfosarcinaceae bacterium]